MKTKISFINVVVFIFSVVIANSLLAQGSVDVAACPAPRLLSELEQAPTFETFLDRAAFEIVQEKMQKIQNRLTESFCSTNPEDWVETNSQEESAFIHTLSLWNNFQSSPNLELRAIKLAELFAIELYAGFYYQVLNPLLFSLKEKTAYLEQAQAILTNQESSSEKFKYALIQVMSHGLNKLPRFQKTLYRSAFSPMSTDPEAALKKSQDHYDQYDPEDPQKNIYSFSGFMSTTRGEGEHSQDTFVNSARLLLIIEKNHSGRQIDMISSRPEEEEVLFLPFSKFIVNKKETVQGADGQIQYRMYLSEIEQNN